MAWPAHIPQYCSEEEFLALPEGPDRIELIDGEVIVSPSPLPLHQVVVGRLYVALQAWAAEHPPAFVGLSPLDVRLGTDRIVQPDLFVVRGGVDPRRIVDTVPDLVVEVLSGNRAYDRLAKRALYEEAGVGEYWIADPDARRIEQVTGGRILAATDRLRAAALDGVEVDVEAVFAGL